MTKIRRLPAMITSFYKPSVKPKLLGQACRARPVGPRAVGPRAVGPRAVGPRAVGPRGVGPRAVGPGLSGQGCQAMAVIPGLLGQS